MCECKKLTAKFEGMSVAEINDLSNLVEVKTNHMTWATIYQCIECGQLWKEKYEQKGHGEVPSVYKLKTD